MESQQRIKIFTLTYIILSIILLLVSATSSAEILAPVAETVQLISQLDVVNASAGDNEGHSVVTIVASSCVAYFNSSSTEAAQCRNGEVPVEVAVWLFLLAIFAFMGFLSRNKL